MVACLNFELESFVPDGGQLHQQVHAPLARFNEAAVGSLECRNVGLLLRTPEGEVAGGAWGAALLGWLQVDGLVVEGAMRHLGLGSRLLQGLEHEALQIGCHSAWVDTFDFQARGFYEKRGYQLFGALDDFPLGHERYFLRKRLKPLT